MLNPLFADKSDVKKRKIEFINDHHIPRFLCIQLQLLMKLLDGIKY